MPSFTITLQDVGGVDQADVQADSMDDALEAAMDELGRPLSGRDEGDVTIQIRVTG